MVKNDAGNWEAPLPLRDSATFFVSRRSSEAHSETNHQTSPLSGLNPVIDPDGLVRVGGRIERSNLIYEERHPLILLGKQGRI